MAGSTKAVDPAFHNVGQKPGTEIWRIENFQPVPLPKSDYGKFHMGDSYIVLQTSSGRGGAYLYDIHFWLGKDTSQDEAGTAAIKTVELDAHLGGRAVQHRELQGFETDKFLSYFKPCIIPLEGGVASGFKTPEEEEFETRLYICKGKRVVKVKQVQFARSSLNHDDVFILDTKDKIFQFNGANSNIQERAKALEVVQYLKDTYHEGTCNVAFVDDGKLQAESDSGEFWVLFGGFAPIGRKVIGEDDAIPEPTPAKLYSANGGQLDPMEGDLSKGMLENTNCYLLDCGDEIFVWFGRATQVDERKSACQAADDFVTNQGRPKATRITRHMQGYESPSFKAHFNSWPAGPATSTTEEGRGKVSAFLKQQGAGAKGAAKGAPAEEMPPLLAAGGKIDVWRVDGNAKTPVDRDDIGKFYSGDCYILLYTYHSSEKKEDFYLCWWAGKDSIQEERKMAAKLANTMCNSMKGRPVLGRMYQGKEPPQFLALFQPMAIFFKGGLSSGYKQYLQDQGLKDETYAAEGAALFRISGTSPHNSRAVQVDTVATSLNTHECFVLQTTNAIFTWQGSQSTFEVQQIAVKVAEILKPGGPLKHAKEGTETSVFWGALGGKQAISSQKPSQNIIKDPHLYLFSTSKGNFQVEEIYNFTQDDLLTEDVLIFDAHAEVFVWVGQTVDTKTKQTALEIGENYVERASTTDGLSKQVPLYKVTEGNEPCFFTAYFSSWDPAKASVYGNSFQKKVVILFGFAETSKSNASSQGGHTQRASALAALNSAFNTSADDKASMSPRKSDTSGQGPTQRASALAALNSAFGSSDKKTASPRLSSSGGSQRAAAMAALSQALTAEKKDGSSPSQGSGASTLEAAAEGEGVEGDMEENAPQESNAEQESIKDTYSYEELRSKSENPVTGIDYKRREAYLSDDEFKTIFGITKEDFYEQPRWKQDIQKKKHDLF